MRLSSLVRKSLSMKANLFCDETTFDRMYAFWTRLIQFSMLSLSNGGKSGFLRACTWALWLERAALTVASVAMADCRSRSSLSCCRATQMALAVILWIASSSMAGGGGRGCVEGRTKTGSSPGSEEGVGEG